MKDVVASIICDIDNQPNCSKELGEKIRKGLWVQLLAKGIKKSNINAKCLPQGPGVILKGGGSSGKHQLCLLSYNHLNQSALSTAIWLEEQGHNPENCFILNALPLCHVSGFMPWWRSRCWKAQHMWLDPKLMHDPNKLEKKYSEQIRTHKGPLLTSLVPTQLMRLIQHPAGIRWLQMFSIIWVGGSAIPENLLSTSRKLKLRLAPCYGTTETTAMVAVQTPADFLSNQNSSLIALKDIQFRIGTNNALQIKTVRLAKVLVKKGTIQSIENKEGWWESGDSAELINKNQKQAIKILGRRDSAINSGGEIVFTEQINSRLIDIATKNEMPIDIILLTPIKDEEWGERLAALVKFKDGIGKAEKNEAILQLKNIVKQWPPYERPIAWHSCPELSRNSLGKWEMDKWQSWLKAKDY